MRLRAKSIAVIAAALAALSTNRAMGQTVGQTLSAFPGAVGFGAGATGGRAGTKIEIVTNTLASGAGSFAAAVAVSNSIVIFDVGGYIDLDGSEIAVANDVTIEGQTAPGMGIGFLDGEISFSNSSNDIVNDIRIRQGDGVNEASGGTDTGKASIEMDGGNNIILNHVSEQFGEWDSVDLTNSTNVTIQNSMIDDAIGQQFGIHAQSDSNMTYAYNVIANNHNRNPDIEDTGSAQFINNVVYDTQAGFTSGATGGTRNEDMVGNYYIAGPTGTSNLPFYQVDSSDEIYASGNMVDTNRNGTLDGSAFSAIGSGAMAESQAWFASTGTMPTFSAAAAYYYDTAYAGDSLSRDSLDALDISQVESLGTAGGTTDKADYLYTHPYQDGLANNGYGTITGGAAPVSGANDGIPDTWAEQHGVLQWSVANGTTTDNSNFAFVKDPIGYDEIEDYANQLANQFVTQTWTASSGTWSTANNWTPSVTETTPIVPQVMQAVLIRGTGSTNGAVTVNTSGNYIEGLSIGGNGPAAGEQLNVTSGGGLTVEDTITVGDQNNGTFSISAGAVSAANMQLGNTVYNSTGTTSTTYTGTLNLNGGILTLNQLVLGGGTPGNWNTGGAWSWSGGTLQAATGGLFVNAPATIGSGGAFLDTNGQSAYLTGVMSGQGAFTKIGLGTATLTGANNYTGATNVNVGQLTLGNGSGSGTLGNTPINIANNATFLATASSTAGTNAASLTAANGSTLSLADGTVGKFTLNGAANGNTLMLSGATLDFDLGSNSADELLVNGGGSTSASGNDTIYLAAASGVTSLTNGNYTIIGDAGGGLGTGNFSLGTSSLVVGSKTYYFSLGQSTSTAEILTISPTAVPEPASLGLLAVSMGILMRPRRRAD